MSIYDEYKKWTLQEELFIIDHMDKLTTREIAERLGVNTYKTSTKIRYMRKIYLDNNKNITENDRIKAADKLLAKYEEKEQYEKENQFIAENHETMTMNELANALGLTYAAVYNRRQKLHDEGRLNKRDTALDRERETAKPVTNIDPMPKKMKLPDVEEENQRILKMKIAELDGNLSIGRKYRITKPINNGKERTVFEGILEKIYDRFYNIKGPYMESFLKIDFIIGEYTIEEA